MANRIDMEPDPNWARLQACFNSLTRYIVPLFLRDRRGALHSHGTGLLVSTTSRVFLISAAHVLDKLRDNDVCFYAGERVLRNVTGEFRVTSNIPGKAQKYDRIDVGVCMLQGEYLPPYPDLDKVALPITALRPLAYPREHKQYLFTGFPASKSKVNPHRHVMETKPYGTRLMSASKEGYEKVGYDPRSHIVMPFNHRKAHRRNGTIKLPDQWGISGSPLWSLYDEVNDNDSANNTVVGIVTEYHKDKCLLVASDIAAAILLINEFN
ncbi:MAG: hypothetical protein ACLP7P_05325 [Rhodomicrobium sp.]